MSPLGSNLMARAWALRWPLLFGAAFISLYFLWTTGPRSAIQPQSIRENVDLAWSQADRLLGSSLGGLRSKSKPVAHDYALSESQCSAAFPGLFRDIEDSVRARQDRPITLDTLNAQADDAKNTRVLIYDGEIYIIDDYGRIPEERTIALLSSLHRAVVADPDRETLPNIEFIMSRDDYCDPGAPLWCMTRTPQPLNNFLIPDFGFWSWPIESVGSYPSVYRRIMDTEAQYKDFSEKVPKLVWRGSLDVDHDTRARLVEASKGQRWSDVEPIAWFNEKGEPQRPSNLIGIEDHCRYQFIAHSEGNTFSGRQKYIQNCGSIVVAHPLMWLQPFQRFMVAEGPDQNYVQVKKDYSDLREKMEYYLANPREAARIAQNSVKTFRNRYLVPATEACHWRRLIRSYGRVSFRPSLYAKDSHGKPLIRGTPYENYIVRGNLDNKPPRRWQ